MLELPHLWGIGDFKATTFQRATLLKRLLACGMLAGLALCPKLWISTRGYPLAPVFETLRIAHPWDLLLTAAFASAVVAAALLPRPSRAILLALALGGVLVCLDQSRLQPWFYQYLLMLAALLWAYGSREQTRYADSLSACRLFMAAIYFWSGIQKLNPNFARDVLPWMFHPFGRLDPHLAAVAPFIEIGIAVGLLANRTRNAAALLAISMHCILLAALGPFGRGHNSVVWPWNAFMMAAVLVLFWRTPEISSRAILLPGTGLFFRVAIVSVAALPALSLAGSWDNYLSWALYSGNKDQATYYITDALYDRLPEEAQDYVYEDEAGTDRLDIYEWSWDELNVPVYPERRIYLAIAKWVCGYARTPQDLRLNIRGKALVAGLTHPATNLDCSQIAP